MKAGHLTNIPIITNHRDATKVPFHQPLLAKLLLRRTLVNKPSIDTVENDKTYWW